MARTASLRAASRSDWKGFGSEYPLFGESRQIRSISAYCFTAPLSAPTAIRCAVATAGSVASIFSARFSSSVPRG